MSAASTSEGFNPLSPNATKCSDTLKQFVANLPKNCLTVFDHFVALALKGLITGFHQLKTNVILVHLSIILNKN